MQNRYENEITNWFSQNFSFGFTDGLAGRLRYALQRRDDAKGLAIIVSGRTEFIEKYQEVVYDLRDTGFCFCLYDHYGQGKSARPLADREKGHVDDFSIYVRDLQSMISRFAADWNLGPVVLICHSMGGAIATLACSDNSELIDGLVLVSPMFQINTGRLPPWLVEMLTKTVCHFGGSGRYVPNGGPFRPDLPFAGNVLTGDERRFNEEKKLMAQQRELRLGDPTFGWLLQAYRGMRAARAAAERICCPVLLLAALNDRIVEVSAMETFSRQLRNAVIKRFVGARHELLMEQDYLRNDALSEIRKFLASLSGSVNQAPRRVESVRRVCEEHT